MKKPDDNHPGGNPSRSGHPTGRAEKEVGTEREVFLVYITTPDEETAERLAESLIDERLAACVNLLGPIRSVYRWEGRVEKSGEQALLAKTTGARLDSLTRRVVALHPYDCPCVVAVPVSGGHPAFLDWIHKELP